MNSDWFLETYETSSKRVTTKTSSIADQWMGSFSRSQSKRSQMLLSQLLESRYEMFTSVTMLASRVGVWVWTWMWTCGWNPGGMSNPAAAG